MGTRHSEYSRDAYDWYVEHSDVSDALFGKLEAVGFDLNEFHDPCCGLGTIIDVAGRHGIQATGADILDRAHGRFAVRDFLQDGRRYANIVTNPPSRKTTEIVRHALEHVLPSGVVIVLVPLNFMASQARYPLHRAHCRGAFILSQRPSIPPGDVLLKHGEQIRKSGSIDFCWLMFSPQHPPGEVASICWLEPTTSLSARAHAAEARGGWCRRRDWRCSPA